MKDKHEVIATRMIEPDLDLYDTFFDHAWAVALSERAPEPLRAAVDNLCLSWKEAANTHRLPWLMIRQMEAFAGGFMRRSKPDMAVLIGEFRDWLLRELDGDLKRVEKRAVTAAVKKIDQRLRLASQARDARFPAREYWADVSKQSEVALSITGSQNLAYCALFFGYEWFLVSGFRALGGSAKLKPNQDKFWDRFGELLGRDPKPTFWEERPLRVARHARNSIAHTGGKAKPELVAEAPDLFVSGEGLISVRPADNHALFRVLREKVDRLVDEMARKLERPTAA